MVTARRRSRLPRGIQEELIKYFCGGVPARSAAELTGVNRNTAILFYHKLREVIFAHLAAETSAPMFGEIEADESYFGGRRKGKRGRGAAGKVPVFGLLKRGAKVHVVIVPDTGASGLLPALKETVRPDGIVCTDCCKVYDVLDVSEFHHRRINHSQLFAKEGNHINGIATFRNPAKRHLRSYNGIPRQPFHSFVKIHSFVKKREWRFNYRSAANLGKALTGWWCGR